MTSSLSPSTPPAPEEQEKIKNEASWVSLLKQEIGQVIVGQKYLIDRLVIGLLANGHVLLEGVPGLAKTLAVKTLSDCMQGDFKRIQFTPDLLPADVVGTLIYSPNQGKFTTKKGPIFTNLLLADEINRAPGKVQSALLQAMQEREITIGSETFKLDDPFLVLATQNPLEQQGTYPLPEAQLDRFMLKVIISYPKKEHEQLIMRMNINQTFKKVKPVLTAATLLKARETVREVYMDEKIERYILDIVFASRNPQDYGLAKLQHLINYGGSPRASINLALASKAYAFIKRRGYVIPEDVRAICYDVMRHRIGVTYEAEAENITSEDIIKEILNKVEVP